MKVVGTISRAVIVAGTVIGVAALATAAAIGIGGFPPSRAEATALTPSVSTLISVDVPAGIAATSAARHATSGIAAVSDRAETRTKAQSRPAIERRVVASALKAPKARTAVKASPARSHAKHAVHAKRAASPHVVKPRSRSRSTGRGWRSARVSWYGPGFYGHTMAGGGKLQRGSMVVAHRSLPFGTRVRFTYQGHTVVAVVRDRGPYVGGRTFDLGPGTAKALGFSGVGTVRYDIL